MPFVCIQQGPHLLLTFSCFHLQQRANKVNWIWLYHHDMMIQSHVHKPLLTDLVCRFSAFLQLCGSQGFFFPEVWWRVSWYSHVAERESSLLSSCKDALNSFCHTSGKLHSQRTRSVSCPYPGAYFKAQVRIEQKQPTRVDLPVMISTMHLLQLQLVLQPVDPDSSDSDWFPLQMFTKYTECSVTAGMDGIHCLHLPKR